MTMAATTGVDAVFPYLLILLLISGAQIGIDASRVFTIINDCKVPIWPAITPGNNFGGGGFVLRPGESRIMTAPAGWSGRIWARTGCKFDGSGNGSCQTGSCGSTLQCSASGKPPASLAEFTLGPMDFYDVSLVDGFNLPIVVRPVNGRGNCSAAGCDGNLLTSCPKELEVRAGKSVVACRSACDVFNTDQYCCRGVYGNSVTCTATYYSKKFKEACPGAYSYAYDDPTSIFTCTSPDYIISFCSTRNQVVCTYHDNKLVCSGSSSVRAGRLIWTVYAAVAVFLTILGSWVLL